MDERDGESQFMTEPSERFKRYDKKVFGFEPPKTEVEKIYDTVKEHIAFFNDAKNQLPPINLSDSAVRSRFDMLDSPQFMYPPAIVAVFALRSLKERQITKEEFISLQLSSTDLVIKNRILELPGTTSIQQVVDLLNRDLKISIRDLYRIFDFEIHLKRLPSTLKPLEQQIQELIKTSSDLQHHENVWKIYIWLLKTSRNKNKITEKNELTDLYKFQTMIIRYAQKMGLIEPRN